MSASFFNVNQANPAPPTQPPNHLKGGVSKSIDTPPLGGWGGLGLDYLLQYREGCLVVGLMCDFVYELAVDHFAICVDDDDCT